MYMTNRNEQQKLERLQEVCKERGLRLTPQRIMIYRELIKSKDHPSADIVYKAIHRILPNISFDTVNRTVTTFAEIGLLRVVEGYGEPKRFDPHTEQHHHFRCVTCNRILDFDDASYDQLSIPQDIEKAFTVLNKRVVIEGICDRCGQRKDRQ